ncbi:hypothetical protein CSUI_004547 [Cystoisospora suis]|uniref:Uncharacterized protein n=1 Tax=Cystoisospora suis TaxID=483139 RepID=A0A2C6KMB4_9APIC|nr:hypothetical protein CSUI_004547 [Cystoisospora suis]
MRHLKSPSSSLSICFSALSSSHQLPIDSLVPLSSSR